MAADSPLDRHSLVPRSAADRSRPETVGADVARSLHDNVAQELFLARMTLDELAERLGRGSPESRLADCARERVRAALRGTRALIDGLRSADDSTECDLSPALRRELIAFSALTGIAVFYSETGLPGASSPQVVAHVLAIVREALANVHKHAGASEVRLRARYRQGWTRLTVTDDGLGFTVLPMGSRENGMGIGMGAMHERARAIGGRIALRSAGTGTAVTIEFPPQGALADAR